MTQNNQAVPRVIGAETSVPINIRMISYANHRRHGTTRLGRDIGILCDVRHTRGIFCGVARALLFLSFCPLNVRRMGGGFKSAGPISRIERFGAAP
jgi:hypothetical protein